MLNLEPVSRCRREKFLVSLYDVEVKEEEEEEEEEKKCWESVKMHE